MDVLLEIIISSIPILILIGIWIYFMRGNRSGMQTQQLMPEYMEKDIAVKERIAVALEKLARNERPQDD